LAEKPEAIEDYGAQEASEVGADEIVFSNDKNRMDQAKEEVSVEQDGLSSQAINALWMRRLQSTPADFMRLKFRYQIEMVDKPSAVSSQEGQP
jgi:Ca-activated chloride channel family protein